MGVPATQGKLCTTLKEMEVGDYIRCTYTALTANVVGDFTDLGGTRSVMELSERPRETSNGYFYYLKVDKGLLVADRMVQAGIAYASLNAENYILGAKLQGQPALVRVLSTEEFSKYLTSTLNGSVLKDDISVWKHRICALGATEFRADIITQPGYLNVFSPYLGAYSVVYLEITSQLSTGYTRLQFDPK